MRKLSYFCVPFTKMKKLKEYTIQISGLKEGVHHFDFRIDDSFFELFEFSPIKKGNLKVDFYFDKQPGMYVLIFETEGKVAVECDRCLEEFMLPIKSSDSLIGKFKADDTDEADIIFIPKTAVEINIAEYIYEFIVLSVPLMKMHEDAGEECPNDVYQYLDDSEAESDETEKGQEKNNPFADALKNFKDN